VGTPAVLAGAIERLALTIGLRTLQKSDFVQLSNLVDMTTGVPAFRENGFECSQESYVPATGFD